MLKDDAFTFYAVWLTIESIHTVTHVCIAITVLWPILPSLLPLPAFVRYIALVETLFYFFFFLPWRSALDALPPACTSRSRDERRELFYRCIKTVPDIDQWFSIWFKEVDISYLHREDIKLFLSWGFFNKTWIDTEDEEELEEYVRVIEKKAKRTFPLGSTGLMPCRVSTDRLCLEHKPLIYYALTISIADTICHILMSNMSFKHYRLPITSTFSMYPLRPLAMFTNTISPSKLSYWYRPHTSRKRMPVLFIHGIGVGLQIYTALLHSLLEQLNENDGDPDDGQVGVLALEVMPISFRITGTLLPRDAMVHEIRTILNFHGWTDFVIAAHSFGSIFATHLLRGLSAAHPEQTHPLVLVDPVTLSIHFAEIPYNFIYRKPRTASELLCSFAATDVGVCPSIMRLFDWTQNVLWLEEIADQPVTVFLAGRDVIVDAEKLRRYLKRDGFIDELDKAVGSKPNTRARRSQRARDARVVFHGEYNHGEILIRAQGRRQLAEAIAQACQRKGALLN